MVLSCTLDAATGEVVPGCAERVLADMGVVGAGAKEVAVGMKIAPVVLAGRSVVALELCRNEEVVFGTTCETMFVVDFAAETSATISGAVPSARTVVCPKTGPVGPSFFRVTPKTSPGATETLKNSKLPLRSVTVSPMTGLPALPIRALLRMDFEDKTTSRMGSSAIGMSVPGLY